MILYVIYQMRAISDPKLCEIPVVKETDKTYRLSGHNPEARYATVVQKDRCPFSLTPEDAWRKFERDTQQKIQRLEAQLHEEKKKLTFVPQR